MIWLISNSLFECDYEYRISRANAVFESSWKPMLVGFFIEFGQVDGIPGIIFD